MPAELPTPRPECVAREALAARNVAGIKSRLDRYARMDKMLRKELAKLTEQQQRSQARAVKRLRDRAAAEGEGNTA